MHLIDSNDKATRMQQGEKQQFFKDQNQFYVDEKVTSETSGLATL